MAAAPGVDDASATADPSPDRPYLSRRRLAIGFVVLVGCAGCLTALRRIPDWRVQQAYAVLLLLEHRRCATAASEVEVGWSHDRLKRRFGDRLTVGRPSGGRPATPGLLAIEREAHLYCQRPHSVRQFDHGVTTDYLFSLDPSGKVISIEVADHRYVDD